MSKETMAFVLSFLLAASMAVAGPRIGIEYDPLNYFPSGGTSSVGNMSVVNFAGDNVSCTGIQGGIATCNWTTYTPASAPFQGVLFSQGDGGMGAASRFSISDGGAGGRTMIAVTALGNYLLTMVDAGTSSDIVLGTSNAADYAAAVIARAGSLSQPQDALWDTSAFGIYPQYSGTFSQWNSVWSTGGNAQTVNPDAGNPDGGSSGTYKYTHRHFGIQTTGALNSSGQVYMSSPSSLIRGDTSIGGFMCVFDFAVDYQANTNGFIGVTQSSGLLGTYLPFNTANAAGVGWDNSNATHLNLIGNGAASLSSASCLLSGQPYRLDNQYQVYRLTVNARQNAAGVLESLQLKRLDDPSATPCTFSVTGANQIASTVVLVPRFYVVNNAAGSTAGINVFGAYCQVAPL